MSALKVSDLPNTHKYVKTPIANNATPFTIWIIFGVFLYGLALLFVLPDTNNRSKGSDDLAFTLVLFLFTITVIAIVILIFMYKNHQKKLSSKFNLDFKNFLATNNFVPTPFVETKTENQPFIYGMGTRNAVDLGFTGKIGQTPFFAYAYVYYRKRKNSEQEYPFTIFRFSISKPLPHLVLDSRKNDGIISSIPRFFSDDQRIELEGDFNEYFDLFAPRDYEVEALDILSPDFMQMLMDFHSDFDVEINKNEVYLISRGIKYDQISMQEMFQAAEVLIEKFNQKLKVWSMAAMAKNLPELDSHTDESAIRIGRHRISTAVFTIPLASLYIAARFSEGGFNFKVFFIIFVISTGVLIILRRKSRKRN